MRTSDAADDGGTAIWTLASLRQNGFGTLGTGDATISQGARLPALKLALVLAMQAPATHEVPHGECVSTCTGTKANHCSEDDECVQWTSVGVCAPPNAPAQLQGRPIMARGARYRNALVGCSVSLARG